MSELTLTNSYERRLNQKDTVINRLQERNALLSEQVAQLTQRVDQQAKLLKEKDRQIDKDGQEKAALEATIEKFKEMFKQGEQRFQELYSTAVHLSQPNRTDMALLIRNHGVELYLKQMKIQMLQDQLTNLSNIMARKNQTVARLMNQNTKLRQNELQYTTEHYAKIQELKYQVSHLENLRKVQQSFSLPKTPEDIDVSTTYEQILSLKDEEIQNLRNQVKKNKKQVKELLEEIRELQVQKDKSHSILFEGGLSFEQVLIQNANLKEENQKIRKDLEFLKKSIPDLQEYRNKIKKQLGKKDKWVTRQHRIAELETEISLAEGKHKVQIEVTNEQNKRLRQRQGDLTRTNLQLEIIIEKMNKAFKIINPYFSIYQYDLAQLNKAEVAKMKNLESEAALAVRINELKAKQSALAVSKDHYDSQLAKAKRDCIDFRKELAFYKDVVKKHFNMGNLSSNQQHQQQQTNNRSSQIQQKCVKIIKQLVSKIDPLQRSYNQLLIEFNLLQMAHSRCERQLRPIPIPLTMVAQIPPQIVLQQSSFAPPDSVVLQQLQQVTGQVTRMKQIIAESENTLSYYSKYFEEMQRSLELFRKTQIQLIDEKQVLETKLKVITKELEDLKAKASAIVPQELESIQVSERNHSMISLPEIEEKGALSEESLKRLSELIDSNVHLLDKMEAEYVQLKENYEKASRALLLHQNNEQEDTQLETEILKKKLTQAAVRIESSDIHERALLEENSLLKRQNKRLHQAVNDIEESRQREHQIQKTRQQAILEQVKTNLQQREGILIGSYTPGLDSAGDVKLIRTLTQLIQDKNNRIDILEQRLHDTVKQAQQANTKISLLTTSQHESLADLLDRAAQMIESLQKKE